MTPVTRPVVLRAPHDPVSAAGRLAGELVARWRAGERPTAADLAARSPQVRADRDAVLELLAEELALREEYAAPADPAALAAAFPEWAAEVRALLRCHAALGPAAVATLPAAGDDLGEFRLMAELGRGAVGRVFLAVQPALANRPVVLKLSPAGGGEHLSLARLQHSHIVPLYSAHHFPDHALDGLCLPYFGGATLAAALAAVGEKTTPVTGADLLAAARGAPPAGVAAARPGPVWAALASASYVNAACRVAAALAAALQYAHDRGLLHLDVKPSNVLLAGDGTPMLLDFHLARAPLAAGAPAPPSLGGTPSYMPPEQEAAVVAVRWQQPLPAAVDARADVFALGLLLRAMLAAPSGAAAVRAPVSLLVLIARCTAPDPARRYPSAAAVAADLRRHLADQPLRGVRNGVGERWRKWRRRRPGALPLVIGAAAVIAAIIGLGGWGSDRAKRGETAYRTGAAHLAAGRPDEAAAAFRAGSEAVSGVPFTTELQGRLDAGRRAADRGRASAALRAVCDRLRPVYGAEVLSPASAAALRSAARELWAERDRWENPTAAERDELLDLAVLLAELEPRADLDPAAHRRALAVLDEAAVRYGAGPALDRDRAAHLRALGDAAAADAALARAAAVPPRTAWDHLAAGRAALAAGAWADAAAHFDRAAALEPGSFWAGYYAGVARLRAGDAAGALAAFAGCAAVAPDRAWCVANRGLAYLELGRPAAALADFDRALTLDPNLEAARRGRAAALGRVGKAP